MKKKKWIIIVSAWLIIGIPLLIFWFNSTQTSRHNNRLYDILYEDAVQFVKTETDAQQKYGDNLDVVVTKMTMDLSDNSLARQKFENYEHFISELKEATLQVSVNRKHTCVVVFTKNEQGVLEVSDWYWAD